MLKIRMQRVGRINQPSYRIVITEHARGPKAGKIVEKVGTYNPSTKVRTLNEDRVKYWISVGAQPSHTMHNMLVSTGVISGKKINVLPAYKAPEAPAVEEEVKETPVAEAPAEEAAPETTEAPTEEPVKEEAPAEESAAQ